MAAALMAMIDISIVNVALTDIRASFGTPIDQIGWVSTGYMMANIVVIPMTGWLPRPVAPGAAGVGVAGLGVSLSFSVRVSCLRRGGRALFGPGGGTCRRWSRS